MEHDGMSLAARFFLFLAIVILGMMTATMVGLTILVDNNKNGELLVDCVTPGDDPPPETGHECWDRLHDPDNAAATINVVLEEGDCRQRRAMAGLTAPPDSSMSCAAQTPPDIYPGPSTTAPTLEQG